ncbi:MAG: helix-turn-helix transcriptional regulator [Lachnospiraceae bacterium]|nr:helix-turn-helix transcriptional regulator [Lachnospiraceae bacterium]
MIIYDRFWKTLKDRGMTQYTLIYHHHISSSLMHRLKNNSNINTYTLNMLCDILNCRIEDIAEYVKD